MRRKKLIILLLAVLVAATGLTVVAVAAAQNGLPGGSEEQEAPVAAPVGAISPDQAAQAAADATGQTASGVELDDENGTIVYEVQAGGSEVAVEAGTGKVLKVETEGAEGVNDDNSTADHQSSDEVDSDNEGAHDGGAGQR